MHIIWTNLLHLDIPVLEKVLRTVVVYFFLVLGLRLAGKRELAQLNPFDLVVLLTLSNALQNAIIGNDNSLVGGLVGAAVLLLLNHFVVRFLYDHQKLDRVVEGDCTVLIENGQLQTQNLKAELITVAEMEAQAHRQGFASLAEVDRAILEPGGTLSFFAKKPEPEVSRHAELLSRLDAMSQEIAQLRAAVSR